MHEHRALPWGQRSTKLASGKVGGIQLASAQTAKAETSQTGSYVALANIDDPEVDDKTSLAAVEAVLGPPGAAIARLTNSVEPKDKYGHHLLVRYLYFREGDREAGRGYLNRMNEAKAAGQRGSEHPWPLIRLYQA